MGGGYVIDWTVAIGVDTHKDRHTASAFDRLGRPLGRLERAATAAGYLELLEWAESLGEPAFAIEGTASYGAGLARVLVAAGRPVYEVERPKRQEQRQGKSDPLDADRAARRLLAGDGLAELRGGGQHELLRALLVERRSAQAARTVALNQLQALLVTAPAGLRERLATRRANRLVAACRRLPPLASEPQATALIGVLRRLATRIGQLDQELSTIDQTVEQIVNELAPQLLDEYGIGPFCAAQLLVSVGDPRRLRSKASLARLAGVSPLPASSGKTIRHRLNHSGNHQLNYALHVIALHRVRFHPETRAYQQRLLDRGKTKREAMRCIKRAISRHLHRPPIANHNLHHATT
jgi:transposase